MDLYQLRLFLTLTDTLHFHKAAELSHVSPSTLSRSIQSLEEELGTALFERNNRSVSLTPHGIQLHIFARETLQQWETLKDTIQKEQGKLHGTLSLYCSVTASYSFLYDILSDFRQIHPTIEIMLHTGDPALALERVLAGHEDVAIAARPDAMPSDIEFKRIVYSPLVLIEPQISPWSSTDPSNSKQYWESVPYIVSEKGVTRERLDTWFRQKKIKPNIYAQVAGHEAIVSMVSLGLGVGVVPKIVLDNSPLANHVISHEFQMGLNAYEVGICVLTRRLKSPIVRAFWEQVKES